MVLGVVTVVSLVAVLAILIYFFFSGEKNSETVEDEILREKILEQLPGKNCGACGFKDCSELAMNIAKGNCAVSACTTGGVPVAQAIGVVMGNEDTNLFPVRAQVMCSGNCNRVETKYEYDTDSGIADCAAAAKLGGGEKSCHFACLGLGNCVKKCPFGAIEIIDGIAHVNYKKCTGCGVCVDVCPKHLIEMIPYDTYCWVGCSSKENASKTKERCTVGCTGCASCEKVCPNGAITVKNRLATINYDICSGCGRCYSVCPQGIIWKADAVGTLDLYMAMGKNAVL